MSLPGNEEQSFAGSKKRKNLVELTPDFNNTSTTPTTTSNNNNNSNQISPISVVVNCTTQKQTNQRGRSGSNGSTTDQHSGRNENFDIQDVDMPPSKRQRSNHSETSTENMNEGYDCGDVNKQQNVEARFLISSKTAGAVIGRAGCNITNLRQTFNATITVPDSPGSPERVMTIVSSVDKVSKIVRQMLKYIGVSNGTNGTTLSGQKTSSGHGSGGNGTNPPKSGDSFDEKSDKFAPAEIRMLLHISHAGALIGKRGSRITQLREETQAGLRVFSDCLPQSTERICAVCGTIDVVGGAVKSILEVVSSFPIKGENIPYEARNFDPYTAAQYGGFTEMGELDNGRTSSMSSARGGAGSGGFRGGAGGVGGGRFPGHQDSFNKRNAANAVAGGLRDFQQAAYFPESGIYSNGNRIAGNGFSSVAAQCNPNSSWSSARSFNSSRRNSNIGNGAGGGGGGGAGAGGLDTQIAQFGNAAAAASQMNVGWFATPGGYNAPANCNDSKALWNNQYNFMYATMGNDQVMKGGGGGGGGAAGQTNLEYITLPDGSFQTEIRVPSKVVGGIIGKNGARINDIRQKSRANIAIDRSDSPNRVITVKGSMAEIQAACSLICKSIEENQ